MNAIAHTKFVAVLARKMLRSKSPFRTQIIFKAVIIIAHVILDVAADEQVDNQACILRLPFLRR